VRALRIGRIVFGLDLSFAAQYWVRAAKADYGEKQSQLQQNKVQNA
jgi:hypothetical protein